MTYFKRCSNRNIALRKLFADVVRLRLSVLGCVTKSKPTLGRLDDVARCCRLFHCLFFSTEFTVDYCLYWITVQ